MFDQAKKRGDSPAYLVKDGPVWKATSWTDYGDEVERAARALIRLGFEPGQKGCILGFNRPEWVVFDLALMAAGGAPAGIYTTCSPDEVAYILNHSEAPVVLLEDVKQWEKVLAKTDELPHLKHVVMMKGAKRVDDPRVLTWEQLLKKGEGDDEGELQRRVDALEPDQVATLIYTSGTTGPPKAVMLSHENLAWTSRILGQVAAMEPGGRVLSYLPLSHIAEQMASIHGPITTGGTVYFAESIDKVADNLKDCRPTLFFGVPRIWEKFHSAIGGKLAGATGAKARIAGWARGVGVKVNAMKMRGEEPSGLDALQYALAKRLVFDKLKAAIGLDAATTLVSGAAPISKEVLEFFASLDLIVQEVYGQSEDSGPTSFNLFGRTRLGTVGPVFPGVDVRIAEDGEIQVKGPNVFLGYYKDEDATNEALVDGWLCSGDLGKIDDEGFLHITGRKKDIIITAGGKNITPKNIESGIKNHPLVHEAVVIGDRRKFLTAVVSPDLEAFEAWKKERGLSGAPHELREVHDSIWEAVEAVNAKLARVEQVKKIAILPRPLSIEEGELTPTLKVKRAKVSEHFTNEIEALYA
ncbi:MAG: AMP-binding protein [Sandaracinaceae bacterium]|nr:AMP-binding protein [Sandaracinaceae bacterium]